MSKLVVVESPSKAKTIQKYLGSGYEVIASTGHIRDLPKSKMGVDIEHGFQPEYIEMREKKEFIKAIKSKAANSDYVYLATDPDREGEAISWHLCQVLALNLQEENRITFNEITKNGIAKGIANPRKIDMNLVDAQQARRILDRIVGYKLSPFLWKKVKRGLSAGRVQSAALRIIVDREQEIRAFVSTEYWTIDALLKKGKDAFKAYLHSGPDGKKVQIADEATAKKLNEQLKNAAYTVSAVKKGTRKKQPAPPFTTSTMQQDASRKLNFNAQRTMRIAQELYEGVAVPGVGMTGLITYMRTDSLRISEDARQAGNAYIRDTYGDVYLPEKPRYYKQKKNVQDAHEAIRPTNPAMTPAQLKDSLTSDQYKLYKLVWERFIASLMQVCVLNTMQADIAADDYLFKASGYSVKFDGYTVLYEEGKDEAEEEQNALPSLKAGDTLELDELTPNQHFTQPPARYTEATLIKTMEENGIGRPSTYAPTISTLTSREYVEREKKALVPTALGEIITGLMKEMFQDIVDLKFTAKVESELDEVEAGQMQWVKVLEKFYKDFDKELQSAEKKLDGTRIKVPEQESDVICEKCGRKMVIRSGRFGKFLACPGFPECKNTKPLVTEMPGSCPKCGGKILLRKSAKGNKYYACEKGKECGFMTWDEPTDKRCPQCGKTLFKRRGGLLVCLDESCGYQEKVERKKKSAGKTAKK
mgnify:CR=1 FL=1